MSCCLQCRCVPSVCPAKFHETAKLAAPWPDFRCVRFRCAPLGKNTGAHRRGRERAPRLPAVPIVMGHTRAHRDTPGIPRVARSEPMPDPAPSWCRLLSHLLHLTDVYARSESVIKTYSRNVMLKCCYVLKPLEDVHV
jgi:hypothetical protein